MISLDSLKIRIPVNNVDVLDIGLKEYWVQVSESGEVDTATYKQKRLAIKGNGITTSYAIQTPNAAIPEESVLIMFNSKLLKSKYLEGIHPGNIKTIYIELMSQNIIHTSYESFLNGFCTDIDIKKDVVLNGGLEAQQETVKSLAKITKASKLKRSGYDLKNSAKNIGVQWNKREHGSISSPYLKVYAKDIELINKSNQFYHEFLDSVTEGLTRIEGTIRDKKHFNNLLKNEVDLTLNTLITLEQTQLESILKIMASKHLEGQEIQGKNKANDLSLAAAFCLAFLDSQNSKSMAKHTIAKFTKDKHQTHRARVLIDDVWKDEIEGTDKGEKGKELDKIFNVLGVGGK